MEIIKTTKSICPECFTVIDAALYEEDGAVLMNKECSGIGQGAMTKESLKEMRSQAKLDYECRTRTTSSLPMLQMLFLQFFQKQSQEAMGSLSEEDKKKIEEILAKEQKEQEAQKEKKEQKDAPPEVKEEQKDAPPEVKEEEK